MIANMAKQTGPQLGPILEIHRGEDSFVSFHVKDDRGQMRRLPSLRVSDLERVFPEYREQLTRDAYFSLNSFWREATHKSGDVRYLNCVYSDLDYYNARTDGGAALATIYRAQKAGHIPPASIILDSGQGMWLIWLIEAPDGSKRPERFHSLYPEKQIRYNRIMGKIHKTIKALEPSLEPDAHALDMSRIAPIPGSIKSKAGRPVRALLQLDDFMNGYAYTMCDMEAALGLPSGGPLEAEHLIPQAERNIIANRAGWKAHHAKRISDLEILWRLRGGFREGHRNIAALVYACHARGLKWSADGIRQRLIELAADCSPPLSKAEIGKALTSSRRMYKWKDADHEGKPGLATVLEITPEELEHLSSIDPSREYHPRKPGPKPKEIKAKRHTEIMAIVEDRGERPPTRKMAELLAERGIEVSYRTVVTDYHDLGLSGTPQMALQYETPIIDLLRGHEVAAELADLIAQEIPDLEELAAMATGDGRTLAEPLALAEWALAEAVELQVYKSSDGRYRRRISAPELDIPAEVDKLLEAGSRPKIIVAALATAHDLAESAREAIADLVSA